jgi:hypothetical protein
LEFGKRAGTSTVTLYSQCHHRTDTGHRHQAPAHVIVSDNGQHAAMHDGKLLANDAPDNEQRFDQYC